MADEQSIPAERSCTKCGEVKLLSEFTRAAHGKFGRSARCRACDRKYFEQNRLRINATQLALYHRKQEPRRQAKIEALQARIESAEKRCCTCKENKLKGEFAKSERTPDRLRKRCKACSNAANKKYREENPEKAKASTRGWAERNAERKKATVKAWSERNRERQSALSKAWKAKNRARIRDNHNRRFSQNPILRVHKAIRERLRFSLLFDSGGLRTFELLGYSRDDLKVHLERQFLKGMSWDNYGEWHVDHIVPLSTFPMSEIDEIRACWALSNLRPLWAKDNLSKRASIHFII